jgi:energy-converting hydrogenase Eha subunit A
MHFLLLTFGLSFIVSVVLVSGFAAPLATGIVWMIDLSKNTIVKNMPELKQWNIYCLWYLFFPILVIGISVGISVLILKISGQI